MEVVVKFVNGSRAREGALCPPERKSPIARKQLFQKTRLFLSVTKFLPHLLGWGNFYVIKLILI